MANVVSGRSRSKVSLFRESFSRNNPVSRTKFDWLVLLSIVFGCTCHYKQCTMSLTFSHFALQSEEFCLQWKNGELRRYRQMFFIILGRAWDGMTYGCQDSLCCNVVFCAQYNGDQCYLWSICHIDAFSNDDEPQEGASFHTFGTCCWKSRHHSKEYRRTPPVVPPKTVIVIEDSQLSAEAPFPYFSNTSAQYQAKAPQANLPCHKPIYRVRLEASKTCLPAKPVVLASPRCPTSGEIY